MTDNIVKHRSEILFWFETNYNNPNGDPIFENRPRVDESDGTCLISPYRIKRTVRDYIRIYENQKTLINNYNELDSKYYKTFPIQNSGHRYTDYHLNDIILDNFIDARLFGYTLPLNEKNKSLEYYGAVQFSYSKSMHPVILLKNQGTAAFASGKNKRNRSFRSEFIIPYSFFYLYGIINENVSVKNRLTEEDLFILEKALWNGINLIQSRTKLGHKACLLLRIEYSKKNFQLNFSKNVTEIISPLEKYEIRQLYQFKLKIDPLLEILKENKINIKKVRFCADSLNLLEHETIVAAFNKYNIDYEIIRV